MDSRGTSACCTRTIRPSCGERIRANSSSVARRPISEVGCRIAGKLLGKDSSPLTDSDYAAMREAVSQHTFYAGKAAGSAGFNG